MGTMAIDSKNSMVSRLEMWIKSDRFYKDGNLKQFTIQTQMHFY